MGGWKIGQVSVKIGAAPAPPAARDPETDRARLREMHAAAQAGDLDRAMSLAEAAVRDGLDHPLALNLAALKLEKADRLGEALALLERAHAKAPEDFAVRNALALALHRLDRNDDALAHFEAVVAAQPQFAPAWCGRGAALDALARTLDAEASYRRALELAPDNLVALAGLAGLLSRRGAHTEARPLAEKAEALQPNFPDAVMTLAAADLAEGAPVRAEARLRLVLEDPAHAPVHKALASGLLGDVLDTQGRVDEAFAAYRAANEALRAVHGPAFAGRASAADFARRLAERFEADMPAAWRRPPRPGAPVAATHVFLLGFPRSGTTLLEQVLASHPGVETLEERDTFAEPLRAYMSRIEDLDRLYQASDAELDQARDAYWARVRAEGAQPNGKVFVDKYPLNTFKLPLIARLFPDAKILLARRDPRDVVLSCFRRRFAINTSMYQLLTLQGAADYYDSAMRMAERIGSAFPLAAHVVRHESLVESFDAEAQAVCEFLGLPWTEALRDFAGRTRDRSIATPSAQQLSRGLTSEGVGAWRRYQRHMAPVLPVLEPWAARFGYDPA